MEEGFGRGLTTEAWGWMSLGLALAALALPAWLWSPVATAGEGDDWQVWATALGVLLMGAAAAVVGIAGRRRVRHRPDQRMRVLCTAGVVLGSVAFLAVALYVIFLVALGLLIEGLGDV